MARPLKESLDYFPVDLDFDQDDKLVVPIAKYGMQGLGIILKVMMNIYRNGYFYAWEEREQYALASKVNVDINSVIGVVNECIKWGFFSQEIYDAHKILTSRGFQKRYVEAAKRRKEIKFREDLVLIDAREECKKVAYSISIVDADGNLVNEYINPDKCNGARTEINKVKESKVKESKALKEIKESRPEPPPAAPDNLPPSQKGKTVKYDPDNTYYKMAVYFKGKIDEMAAREGLQHLTSRTNLQKWADDFRKLVERDKQSDKDLIRSVMDWVVTDDFWHSNILSADKFRDKFPKLVMDMRKASRPARSTGTSGKPANMVIQSSSMEGMSDEELKELERVQEEALRLAESMQSGKTR